MSSLIVRAPTKSQLACQGAGRRRSLTQVLDGTGLGENAARTASGQESKGPVGTFGRAPECPTACPAPQALAAAGGEAHQAEEGQQEKVTFACQALRILRRAFSLPSSHRAHPWPLPRAGPSASSRPSQARSASEEIVLLEVASPVATTDALPAKTPSGPVGASGFLSVPKAIRGSADRLLAGASGLLSSPKTSRVSADRLLAGASGLA
jgi:hypothetical protein